MTFLTNRRNLCFMIKFNKVVKFTQIRRGSIIVVEDYIKNRFGLSKKLPNFPNADCKFGNLSMHIVLILRILKDDKMRLLKHRLPN